MNPTEITRDSYNATAQEYQAQTNKIPTEDKAQDFLRYLWPGQRILDLGCGPGRDLKYFDSKGYEVTGVDISDEMIALARRVIPKAKLMVSGIEEVELEENSFHAVWASASLLHVPKDKMGAVLDKIHRCLTHAGVFYVSMKKGEGEEVLKDEPHQEVKKFWNYVTEEELESLLKAHRFEIIRSTTYDKSTDYQTHPWIAVLARAQKS
ncbi:MAG: class I SAM-dependent methyltransferase [Chlamydiia bacterium]|nr:class I SAM-dependent methyltransferase [Chlamydiia bacterium]